MCPCNLSYKTPLLEDPSADLPVCCTNGVKLTTGLIIMFNGEKHFQKLLYFFYISKFLCDPISSDKHCRQDVWKEERRLQG